MNGSLPAPTARPDLVSRRIRPFNRFVSCFLAAVLTQSLLASPVAAAEKRAFEVDDYYRTAFVGSPHLSPNGEQLAFSVRRYELNAGESWSEIWLMDSDGSNQRQLTHGRHNDTSPLFSPDGETLLFTSNRSGTSQLHALPLAGGESKQLTDFAPGVSDPVWSPDGRYIAVTSQIYPECGVDGECTTEIATDRSEGKLNVHVADDLLYRHWTSWHGGIRHHVLLVDARSGDVIKDMTPGDWESPVFSDGGGYDFSPDGAELCFVSNREKEQASTTNADLWIVPTEGATTEASAINITADNDGWDGAPHYSPDGRWIAYRSQERPGYESDLYRLALFDRESRTTRYLTDRSTFDHWIEEIEWSADSEFLYASAAIEGDTPLYRVELDGRMIGLHEDSYWTGWTVAPEGKRILYTRRAIDAPGEIYVKESGPPQRLTHLNAALEEEVDIRPAEVVWVEVGTGEDARRVQVWIVKPHDFDPSQKYPLVLNVHGGPQGRWADSYRGDWQVYPGKGYIVAFANPTGSVGYGQDFIDAIGCDWGGRVFDDLMAVTDELEALPYVDGDNLGAMGWSYGGYMMMWFEGHTDRFKTLASMMGIYDLPSFYGATEELWFPERDLCGTPWNSWEYASWSPSQAAGEFKTPALVITGELDYRVPYTQSLMFFTALRRQNIPARLVVYPDAGHWPSWHEMAFYYNVHIDWFHKYLGGAPATHDVDAWARNQIFGAAEE